MSDDTPKRGRGRPKNPPGVPNANPKLQLRLEPWLHAWATEKGPEWHRSLLERAYWAEGQESTVEVP